MFHHDFSLTTAPGTELLRSGRILLDTSVKQRLQYSYRHGPPGRQANSGRKVAQNETTDEHR